MSQLEEKKYDVEVDDTNKVFKVVLFGYFQPEDLQFFTVKYDSIMEKISAADYVLHLETKNLRITFFDLEGLLTSCFGLFNEAKFKNIRIDSGTNVMIKQYVQKTAEAVGLKNYVIL